MSIERPRRYYLGKRLHAAMVGDRGWADVWKAKQEEQPGTALPDGFPSRSKLAAVGYEAIEDVDGATVEELQLQAGLSTREASAVLAAIEE